MTTLKELYIGVGGSHSLSSTLIQPYSGRLTVIVDSQPMVRPHRQGSSPS